MRILQTFRQRRDQYWQQQQQIDHYERILDEIRAHRDDLATIANGITEILEEEE